MIKIEYYVHLQRRDQLYMYQTLYEERFPTVLYITVSEKIIIHDCPDQVEVIGNELNTTVFWTPPTAELLTVNGSKHLERSISSTGTHSEPGDLFPFGNTQVEYSYRHQEVKTSCIFTVTVGNFFFYFFNPRLSKGEVAAPPPPPRLVCF